MKLTLQEIVKERKVGEKARGRPCRMQRDTNTRLLYLTHSGSAARCGTQVTLAVVTHLPTADSSARRTAVLLCPPWLLSAQTPRAHSKHTCKYNMAYTSLFWIRAVFWPSIQGAGIMDAGITQKISNPDFAPFLTKGGDVIIILRLTDTRR